MKQKYLVDVGALSRSQANTDDRPAMNKQIEHAVDNFSKVTMGVGVSLLLVIPEPATLR